MSDQDAALAALDAAEQGSTEAAPQGQAVSAPEQGQATVFHEYEWEPGKKDVWNTKDDLNRFLRESGMRHSDYTRKTQQIADSRKMLEQKIKDYEGKERTFNESYPKIMQMDKFLKENPQVAERIAQEMKGTRGNSEVEKLLGERLKPFEEKLSEWEKDKARQAEDKARADAYDAVGRRYKDFDKGVVDAAIQRLQEVPEAMQLEAMVELLHNAEKGRMTPGEVERKQAMVSNKSHVATPTTAVGIPDRQVTQMSRDDEMAAALSAMEAAGRAG